jgi:hypothetical protein
MGLLIAWHYRTTMFAKLADHTYVTCGNQGKAWGCWGGKSGGKPLVQDKGSTKQADAIANPDERAGITCYLVNGVCHQAANRILYPAGVTVRGAKGYAVSEALYGPYGRPRGLLGVCKAPFYKHGGIKGDLPECKEGIVEFSEEEKAGLKSLMHDEESTEYRQYLAIVDEMYGRLSVETIKAIGTNGMRQFQLDLFRVMTEFRLGSEFADSTKGKGLLEVRDNIENQRSKIEDYFQNQDLTVDEFVNRYNKLIEDFQDNTANTLSSDEYRLLLQLKPDEKIVLGDPEIARIAYTGI